MATKIASRKNKGRYLQKWVRDKILHYLGTFLTKDDVRSTSMGASGVDVQLSAAAKTFLPYSIECKNAERINVWKAYEQANSNRTPDANHALLFIKKNKHKPLAVVDADLFLHITAFTGVMLTEAKAKGELPDE